MADNREVVSVVSSLEAFTEDTIKRLTLEVTATLAESTPVLTGWARSNWLPSIGSPVDSPTGTKESVSDAEREARLGQVVLTYRLPSLVHVTNNVPYIVELNEGSSRKAPSGFVQIAIARAIREVS